MHLNADTGIVLGSVLTALGALVASAVFLVLAGLMHVFEAEDLPRFRALVEACPVALAAPASLTFSWLSRGVSPAQTEELL